jgi:predicted nucleic acid-binding protein
LDPLKIQESMRNLFSWRLRPSEAEFSEIWNNAIFVFDTNVLLDLYRASQTTVDDFLNLIEQIKDRIWLPYQVANEFLERREEIIESEAASFQKALKELEKWKSEQTNFNSLRGYLSQVGRIVSSEVEFLFDEQNNFIDSLNEVEKKFREKIEEVAHSHSQLDVNKDKILERLLSLFDSKVGNAYDESTLQKLYEEGNKRYQQSIPPGYKDAGKNGERQYGDFIVWKQILDFAKKESHPIIFITGEKKEDWWNRKDGKILSPRVELRREFLDFTKQLFWIYQTKHFLEMARERLMIEINQQSIEETDAIAEANAFEEQALAEEESEDFWEAIHRLTTPIVPNEDIRRGILGDQSVNEAIRINETIRKAILGDPSRNEAMRKAILGDQSVNEAIRINETIRKAILGDPSRNEAMRKAMEKLFINPQPNEALRKAILDDQSRNEVMRRNILGNLLDIGHLKKHREGDNALLEQEHFVEHTESNENQDEGIEIQSNPNRKPSSKKSGNSKDKSKKNSST